MTQYNHYGSRYYRKRDYEGNLSGFAVGFVFLGVGILSLIMKSAGVHFIGLENWGIWLFIPAFFILLGSVGQYVTDRRIKQDTLAVIRDRGEGSYTLDEIAADAGVKRKNLLHVLMDLRSEGLVKYRYDANTGEILVGETIQYEPAPDYQPLPKRTPPPTPADASEKSFCVFCGQKLANPGARFCPNCGSEIS